MKCIDAVRKYMDPKHPAHFKRIYYQWIENNFSPQEVKQCLKQVQTELKEQEQERLLKDYTHIGKAFYINADKAKRHIRKQELDKIIRRITR